MGQPTGRKDDLIRNYLVGRNPLGLLAVVEPQLLSYRGSVLI